MAIVKFDEEFIGQFREGYPQFSAVSDGQLRMAFRTAALIINNTDRSLIPYDPDAGVLDRETVMLMLCCHELTLAARGDGAVGQVTAAHEGSVSTGFTQPKNLQDAGWFGQTQCGLAAYQIIQGRLVGGRYYGYHHGACYAGFKGRLFPRR